MGIDWRFAGTIGVGLVIGGLILGVLGGIMGKR